MEAFGGLGDVTLLYQYHAEGSLIRGERAGELAGEFVLAGARRAGVRQPLHRLRQPRRRSCGRAPGLGTHAACGRAGLQPPHARTWRRANRELWRENARIARHRLGKADAAAATAQLRVQEELRQARTSASRELEREVARLTSTACSTLRGTASSSGPARRSCVSPACYGLVRRLWAARQPPVSVAASQLGEPATRPLGRSARARSRAERVSKAFRLPHQRYSTLKERALHPFTSQHLRRVLQALDDVSFEVERGEFFGIVGRNGIGKSTLLKCLAGIYGIDAGEIRIERPAVAVHRARRGLQPRPDRPRQRADQRDHARASRGGRRGGASTRSSSSPSSRSSST